MNSKLLAKLNSCSRVFDLKFLLLVAFLAVGMNEARAQVSNYAVDQLQLPSYADLDLTTKTQLVTTANATTPTTPGQNWNTAVSTTIGFTYNFNGVNYSSIWVSPNGFVTFGTGSTTAANSISSASTAYAGAISAFGHDFRVYTVQTIGGVQANSVSKFLDTSGGAGNYILKIEWRNVQSVSDTNAYFNIQMWLYEGTNVAEIRFAPQNGAANINLTGPIGLRGINNLDTRTLSWSSASGDWPAGAGMTVGTSNAAIVGIQSLATRINSASNRLIRFTPPQCIWPFLATTVTAITTTGGTLTWTPPTPAPTGYEYEVRTSGAAGSGATGLAQSGTIAASPLNLTGLTPGVTYTVYVRSNCGGVYSAWNSRTFATICNPVPLPYYEGFDGVTIPNIPTCTKVFQAGTGNLWKTEGPFGDFYDQHLVYDFNGSNAANTWFITEGVNLVAGTTYRLSYLYGGSTNLASITNKMSVWYGTTPSVAGMTLPLADHPQIKVSSEEGIVNFTPSTSGTYYIGFRAYSAANQGKMFLDDIQLVEPGCKPPTALVANNITAQTATVSWTAPTPAPGSGYAYYLTNTNTPPAYQATPTGYTPAGSTVVNLTGLSGSTTYYIWVHSTCAAPNDYSQWSSVLTFTTPAQPVYTYCNPQPSSIDAQGIVNVTFSTVNNSTGSEAPTYYGNYSSLVGNVAQGATVPVAITFNTSIFNYNTKIWIDWNNDSDFYDSGELVYTGLSASTSPNTLNASFVVPLTATLGHHRMRIGGADIDTLNGTGPGQGPCYTGSWGTFEDYTVNVTVPPPALTLDSYAYAGCAGTTTPLINITSNLANYDTFSWSPAGPVSGDPQNGYTITSSSTVTYTLTATQNSFPFSTNSVNFVYTASPLPTAIVINPASATSCPNGPAVALTATGGVVSNLPIYAEDFNGGAPDWTIINNSTGGNVAGAAWQNVNSPYSTWATITSNDATAFYFVDSDEQGSGTTTNVTMASPVFSLAGYNNASLRFFHFLRGWNNGGGHVEISTNGTAGPWTNLASYMPIHTDVGSPSNFQQVNIDLSAYIGQANISIRFRYQANWGWGWAVDNFTISGSATSSITWSPIDGLWNDAAATDPYTGTGTNVVYAMPSTTTVYSASASTPSPTICTTTTTVEVAVTAISGGSVTPATQGSCGTITPLTVAGYSGSIIRWEWSDDPNFATVNVIPSSASPTLTAAQIGTVSGTRYYRAVASVSGCTAYSYAPTAPTYASITSNTVTWNGSAWSNGSGPNITTPVVFAGNYTGNANLSACSVTVSSGNIVFNSGYTLTVANAVTIAGGSLTFNNNASLVQISDSAVNSGYIRYYRTTTPMVRFDYTYWSSMLSPQTLLGVSPFTMADKYFTFNTAANTYVPVPSNSLMTPGKGYIIRAPEGHPTTPTPFTAEFDGGHLTPPDGVPNNGVYTQPIIGPGPNNFNLLGNPYPSALDADLFYAANSTLIDGSFFFWTHNTPINPTQYVQSDYAVYNATGGTGTAAGGTGNNSVPDGNIASGQGFFVKGIANGTATFNNSMRLVGFNSQFYRLPGIASKQVVEKHRVWLDIRNTQGAYKQTLVGYVPGATNDKDMAYDADAVDSGIAVNLYSLIGSDKASIQGRALPFDPADEVPMGYKATAAGQLEITLYSFDGLFTGQNIYLEDKLLNVIHDLKAGSYTFVSAAGTFDDRFVLRYSDTALSVGGNQIDSNAVVVYRNAAGINVQATNLVMSEIRIFDMRGRLLLTKSGINASQVTISNLDAQEQVLLVQITTNDNKTVNKKIVY